MFDVAGDVGTSTGNLPGGKFWALASLDSEEEDYDPHTPSATGDYLITSSEDSGCDLRHSSRASNGLRSGSSKDHLTKMTRAYLADLIMATIGGGGVTGWGAAGGVTGRGTSGGANGRGTGGPSGTNQGRIGAGGGPFQAGGYHPPQVQPQDPNFGLGGEDPSGYGNGFFTGEFGEFDQGYYDGNQGFGNQGYAGYGGNNGAARYRRPRPSGGYRGRGRGRFVARGHGRVPPAAEDLGGQDREQIIRQKPPPQVRTTVPQVNNVVVQNPTPTSAPATSVVQNVALPPQVDAAATAQVIFPYEDQTRQKELKMNKKVEKTLSFRCIQTGHFVVDCTAELCLYCELATHASKDCPKLSMPKPTATMYGMANDGLLFFDLPVTDDPRPKPDSGKIGRIRIEGGTMTVKQVIDELKWFVPGDNQWDITPVDEHNFRVVYPTKLDRARVRKIGDVNVEGTPHKMFFEDWLTEDVNRWRFTDVWVRFHGCPEELRRDYLALFALGSLVGKTKEVDMQFTRENKIVCVLIQVVDPKIIPKHATHSYDGEGYDIGIEVEGFVDIDMEEVNNGDYQNKKDDEKENKKDMMEEDAKQSDKQPMIQKKDNANGQDTNSTLVPGVTNLSVHFGSFDEALHTPVRSPKENIAPKVAASDSWKRWHKRNNLILNPVAVGHDGRERRRRAESAAVDDERANDGWRHAGLSEDVVEDGEEEHVRLLDGVHVRGRWREVVAHPAGLDGVCHELDTGAVGAADASAGGAPAVVGFRRASPRATLVQRSGGRRSGVWSRRYLQVLARLPRRELRCRYRRALLAAGSCYGPRVARCAARPAGARRRTRAACRSLCGLVSFLCTRYDDGLSEHDAVRRLLDADTDLHVAARDAERRGHHPCSSTREAYEAAATAARHPYASAQAAPSCGRSEHIAYAFPAGNFSAARAPAARAEAAARTMWRGTVEAISLARFFGGLARCSWVVQ
ncbi:hypothetical protein ACQ4PT_028795 [Festuca glaucescens]